MIKSAIKSAIELLNISYKCNDEVLQKVEKNNHKDYILKEKVHSRMQQNRF